MSRSFFLVEDHSLMRQGILNYLAQHTDFTCAGMAGNAQDFLVAMTKGGVATQPDVLVTDLNIDGSMNGGISLIQTCHKKFPALKIIVYSMYAAASVVSTAMNAGASGYVSKLSKEEELVSALNWVFEGRTYIDTAISSQLVDYERSLSMFTHRELEILNLIMLGNSNASISESLGLSKRSVENYISHIYDKTGFSTKEELMERFGYKA